MFQKILVPLDGTAHAEHALQLAQQLVDLEQGSIWLLRVVDTFALASGDDASSQLDVASSYLHALAAAQPKSAPTLSVRVQVGDVASVIVDTAAAEQVDLLIMTAEGRLGFGRSILGGVAERVLRTAPCPMLVSRFPQPIRKLLVTLDGSHLAEQAVPLGRVVADRLGAELTLLRVEEAVRLLPSLADKWLARAEGEQERISERLVTDAATYLQQVVAGLDGAGVGVKTAVLTGSVVSSIIDYIETNQVDLVVMATHGFAGLSRWDYGHVTEKIMRGADTSLLITRPAPHQRLE